jgi:hypothetical protein
MFGLVDSEVLEAYPDFVPYRDADRDSKTQEWVLEQEKNRQLSYILGGFYRMEEKGYRLNTMLRDAFVQGLRERELSHQ